MAGAMSRNKGKRGERQVIDSLQPLLNQVYGMHEQEPPTLKRNTLQSDGGGDDITGIDWLSIEVKYQEAEHLDKWWEQCVRQAGADKVPVLVFRRNGTRWCVQMYGMLGEPSCGHTVPVIVRWEHFMQWLRTQLCKRLSG